MVSFILNNKSIETELSSGSLLLDFVRDHRGLKGTKIGCREGDCGACTVLIGTLEDGHITYINATSCLTPIANIHGKHVVTIEGLNMDNLSPAQSTLIESSGTQCGFCTVGFVVSLTGFCLANTEPTYEDAITAISGNICRCTGYKSIEKAAANLVEMLQSKDVGTPIDWLVEHEFIPSYFSDIATRLAAFSVYEYDSNAKIVGGGTDLYVQRPDEMGKMDIRPIGLEKGLKYVQIANGKCKIGAATTLGELEKDTEFRALFSDATGFFKLISSLPIRNISTVVGNFVNASPIGDLTTMFLALDSTLCITDGTKSRNVRLRNFYRGYKDIDLNSDEYIESFTFDIPKRDSLLNLEKVSKRIHLDIASVNSAAQISIANNRMTLVHISAGGVGPTPKYLTKTCEYLTGKVLSEKTIMEASEIMQSEVSPISDVRGSESYKRLLLRQLFFAHFMKLTSGSMNIDVLVGNNNIAK